MAKVLAITNQKGGVGKTTTSVNLAASLAEAGRRVLLVDLDPQGNATMGSGVDKRDLKVTVYHVLLEQQTLTSATVPASNGKFDLLPANRELAGAEVELVDQPHRETRLKQALTEVQDQYDFILLDCPPALNLLTVNGLCAADPVCQPANQWRKCKHAQHMRGDHVAHFAQRHAVRLHVHRNDGHHEAHGALRAYHGDECGTGARNREDRPSRCARFDLFHCAHAFCNPLPIHTQH